jgi:DNA-binding GntR family transcriptional regulator
MATDAAGPPLSKTEYVLERLRQDIRSGAVNAGQPLRQAELAQRYGVSPTPVREALRLLEAEGAISYSPHKGATVAELSPRRIEDLYRLRATVESLATRLAVERLERGVIEEVREIHERIKDGLGKVDGKVLSGLNRDMHFAIYHRGSPLVADHVTALWRFIPPEVTLWSDPDVATELVGQHEQIFLALVDADADRAATLMAEHILTAANHRFRRVEGAEPSSVN